MENGKFYLLNARFAYCVFGQLNPLKTKTKTKIKFSK